MKTPTGSKSHHAVPKRAVLLVPDSEDEPPPPYGVRPGYYTRKQMQQLLARHQNDADAILFIADLLESGNPEDCPVLSCSLDMVGLEFVSHPEYAAMTQRVSGFLLLWCG